MFDWSDEKDEILRRERGIGFQDIVYHIDKGNLIAVADHPNQGKFQNQKILYVQVDDYVYMVPCVESGGITFLKTIIPSRKETKRLLKGGDHEI
jgi:hypothetical protein